MSAPIPFPQPVQRVLPMIGSTMSITIPVGQDRRPAGHWSHPSEGGPARGASV